MAMKRWMCVALVGGVLLCGGRSHGDVVVNELLGSTTGADLEFIELYNTGDTAVDLTDWSIELWESDSDDSGFLNAEADGDSPYLLSGSIDPGGYFLLANELAETGFGVTADVSLPSNAIENSSFTLLLKDAGGNIVNSIFETDGGDGDAANDGAALITPDLTVGPDGPFLPAGFYRVGDGGSTTAFLEFSPQPAESATPGAMNIPEPASLALLGLGGLAMLRRRR